MYKVNVNNILDTPKINFKKLLIKMKVDPLIISVVKWTIVFPSSSQ